MLDMPEEIKEGCRLPWAAGDFFSSLLWSSSLCDLLPLPGDEARTRVDPYAVHP